MLQPLSIDPPPPPVEYKPGPLSLSVLLPKAARKGCDGCNGTGMVWSGPSPVDIILKDGTPAKFCGGAWIFCQRCLGDRVTSIWAWIDAKYFGFRYPPSHARRRAASIR